MDGPTMEVYEQRAAEWAERRPPRYRSEAAAFGRLCLPGLVRVDLGCGPGSYFADLGSPLVGLDGAGTMLQLARRAAPRTAVVQADLARLPFARATVGGAWARASYLHLTPGALPAALAQLHAALALGAPVELSFKRGSGEGQLPTDEFPGRYFAFWAVDELHDVVTGAGYTVDQLDDTSEWLVVRATRARTLPDFVAPDLRVLVCGLNPSLVAADAGYGYAGVTNRFWPAAVAAGLVSVPGRPLAALAVDSVGMTDLVKRATPRASELSRAEFKEGAARVERLVARLRPRVVLFVGLAGWRAAIDRSAVPGIQPQPFGLSPAYLMPSTSGLNAHARLADLVGHIQAAVDYSRSAPTE